MKEENRENLYQCPECRLHYKDKELAEKCEAWCKENKTCNVEIMKQSEEHKNHQRGPASLMSELEEYKKKCEEYLNNWKRERADFLNYKKDEIERAGLLVNYAKENIILNILPILDSIYLAEQHSHILENVRMSEWMKGFEQIKKQIDEFLKKEGIEEIKTMGEKFNPETMEAIEQTEGSEPDMVIEELQKGYKMGEQVIRPAKVKVTK